MRTGRPGDSVSGEILAAPAVSDGGNGGDGPGVDAQTRG
jgi:hypothetical protein